MPKQLLDTPHETTRPRWLIWVSIAILIWNLIGLGSFVYHWTLTPAEIAAWPEIRQDMRNGSTAQDWVSFFIAVTTGTLGAIALLFKRRWAAPLFLVSVIAVIAQFTSPNYLKIATTRDMSIMTFPAVLVVVGAVEWWLTRRWSKAGWLV